MKKLIALVLLVSLGFSQCDGYISIAQGYLSPPYPNYFAAAQEYTSAANCYSEQGDFLNADKYYELAAEHYLTAAGLLVEAAEFNLRGKSYECAADAYFNLGRADDAEFYYSKAMQEYQKGSLTDNMNALNVKIAQQAIVINTGTVEEDSSLMIGIVFLLFVFTLLMLMFSLKRRKPIEQELLEESGPEAVQEKPAPKQKIAPTTAKEKMAQKIRQRYKLE